MSRFMLPPSSGSRLEPVEVTCVDGRRYLVDMKCGVTIGAPPMSMSRKALIQHAASLPVGSPVRSEILAMLKARQTKSADSLVQTAWFDRDGGGGSLHLEVNVPHQSITKPGSTWPGGAAVGKLLDKLYQEIGDFVDTWATDFEDLAKKQGARLAKVRTRESHTVLGTRGPQVVIKSKWDFDTVFSSTPSTSYQFWDADVVEPLFEAVSRKHNFKVI